MQYRVIDVPLDREVLVADSETLSRAISTSVIDATEAAFNLRRKNELKPLEPIVFRLAVDIDWVHHDTVSRTTIKELEERRGRNPENPHWIIYSENYQFIIRNIDDSSGPTPDLDDSSVIEQIKSDEFLDIVRSSDALFEHNRSTLFGLPSGRLSDFFFRTGNLQIKHQFTAAAFFWALPQLKHVELVVADTWSISTTAARFADRLEKYSGRTGIKWHYLSEYLPNSVETIADLRRSLGLLVEGASADDRSAKLLFLCSFSASGKLRTFIESLVGEFHGALESVFVSLFAAEVDSRPLCSIKPVLDDMDLRGADHGVTDPGVKIRDINPSSYFPDYRSPEPERFLVGDAANKDFFERFAGLGIFSVYRTGSSLNYFSDSGSDTKGRHHAFHIDAKRLFSSEPFDHQLRSKFDGMTVDTNDGVLLVPDPSSELLLDKFLAVTNQDGASVDVFKAGSFSIDSPEQNFVQFLRAKTNQTLFVLVPMTITGHTLQRLQVRLRDIVGGPENIRCNIHVVLGVLRPPDQRKIDEISRFFFNQGGSETTGSVRITVVESVVLPNWQEHLCPWTRELRTLSKALKAEHFPVEVDRMLRSRLRVLRNSSSQGLIGPEVFFVPGSESELIFNSGSRFLDRAKMFVRHGAKGNQAIAAFGKLGLPDASEADLCCAVASAIQHWRERVKKTALNPVCIDASTISNNNGFNESKLRAALWRCLTPTELRYGAREGSDFAPMLGRIFLAENFDPNFAKLELESMLAFGREIPRVRAASIDEWHWRETKFLTRHVK